MTTTTTTVADRRTSSAILWLIIALFAKQGYVYGQGGQPELQYLPLNQLQNQQNQNQPNTPQNLQQLQQLQQQQQLLQLQQQQQQQYPQQPFQQPSNLQPLLNDMDSLNSLPNSVQTSGNRISSQNGQKVNTGHIPNSPIAEQQTSVLSQFNNIPPVSDSLPSIQDIIPTSVPSNSQTQMQPNYNPSNQPQVDQNFKPYSQTQDLFITPENVQNNPTPSLSVSGSQPLTQGIIPTSIPSNSQTQIQPNYNPSNQPQGDQNFKPYSQTQDLFITPENVQNNPTPSLSVSGSQPLTQGIIPTSIPSQTQMQPNYNPSNQPQRDQNFRPYSQTQDSFITYENKYNNPTPVSLQSQYQQQIPANVPTIPSYSLNNYNQIPSINGQRLNGVPLDNKQNQYYPQNSQIDKIKNPNQMFSNSYPTQGSYSPTSNSDNYMGCKRPSQSLLPNFANMIPFDMNAMTYVQQPFNTMNDIAGQAKQFSSSFKNAVGGMMLQTSRNLVDGGQSLMDNAVNVAKAIPNKLFDFKRNCFDSIADIFNVPAPKLSISGNNDGQSNIHMSSQPQTAFGQPQTAFGQPQLAYSTRNIEAMPNLPNPVDPPQKISNYIQERVQYPYN